ncbi:MAG: STAS domain-containing protein [Gammaproteobacteria bacterium]|uniref:STAS domain-containing protein n=1 Tax=Rhodoferax sp. TaxID=50421 RepID=UPI0017A21150|nr:STAS domain-containing protein [Rhodoferax sp.]MBU3900126.1 STAS domain-containing protein [Gammaproteobacteria bacterium]MBA3059800.1 STAS domain-containing protein [Rhodoferax sp.]MBU3998753.1 STAS domain-containing protein [Gammaproteobacteria bacterium]MBU4018310.1 STAS domain-containing protein [Gammaproteobacteria bacterium]MBU4082164.1 STAS domain-containing protein [Gammaproteobacteria bacterium]
MLALPQELTQPQANACLRALMQDLASLPGAEAAVDASALSHFDSSALAVLLEFRRAAMAQGKRFSTQSLPQRLADLATLYGVIELLAAAPVSAPAPLN